MTFVITEACIDVKDTACVDVCPVDCIHPGDYQDQVFMIIDPEECIDCGVCLPECPIDAILETEDDDPEWTQINADLAPDFSSNDPVEPRAANDPPKRPENKLR